MSIYEHVHYIDLILVMIPHIYGNRKSSETMQAALFLVEISDNKMNPNYSILVENIW